ATCSRTAAALPAALPLALHDALPIYAHLWMLEPDVAYAFPHDDGYTILAVMFPKDQAPAFKADVPGNFLAKLQGVPDFPRFDPADQASKVLGLIDYATLCRHRPPPGLP